MEQPRRWQIPSGLELLWRSWDEREFLVYHCASGDTHLLDAAAARLLRSLSRGPVNTDELRRQVADSGPVFAEESADYIAELLDELHTLKLVEPAP
jgi:PqqD family protein of HPr-rel-A system